MIGKTEAIFWECFGRLPHGVQATAREKYALWAADPFHPALHFKETLPGMWSVRINQKYRALGRRRGETIVWFWIGTHAEYDRLLNG